MADVLPASYPIVLSAERPVMPGRFWAIPIIGFLVKAVILIPHAIVLYVLFGGTQSVLGPLLGAGVFTLLPEVLRGSAQWRYVLFAAIVIVVMMVRPQGLVTGAQIRRLLGLVREPGHGAERKRQAA